MSRKVYFILLSFLYSFYLNGQVNSYSQRTIPFSPLNGYFLKSTWKSKKAKLIKINSQKEFDKIFGIGKLEGVNTQATPIDFSSSSVLAYILPKTSKVIHLEVLKLHQINKQISFQYSMLEGDNLDSSYFPFVMIKVEKGIKGKIQAIKTSRELAVENSLNLSGNQWIIEAFNFPEVAVIQKNCYFTIDEKKSEISGFEGCNSFFGKVKIDGQKISFYEITSTLKACENMQYELFMKNLSEIDSYKIVGGELFLYKKDVLVMTMESFR